MTPQLEGTSGRTPDKTPLIKVRGVAPSGSESFPLRERRREERRIIFFFFFFFGREDKREDFPHGDSKAVNIYKRNKVNTKEIARKKRKGIRKRRKGKMNQI